VELEENMNPYSIILSADILDTIEIVNLIRKTSPFVDGVKLHLASFISSGKFITDIIDTIAKNNNTLILDLKVGDIGFITYDGEFEGSNAKIIEAVSFLTQEIETVFVTVHGFPGPVSIRECVEVGHNHNLKILLIPYMSHAGAEVFFNAKCGNEKTKKEKELYSKYNLVYSPDYPQTVSDTILGLGELLGVDGYIGPSNNLDILHSYRRVSQKLIASPGFGRQANGVPFEQQFYLWAKEVGPNSAAIVGSMIYNASNCDEVARYIKRVRDAFLSDVSNTELAWIVKGKTKKKEIPIR
jgi:orotidine-5'-phosphate decarboxylase